ncbi:hypothetical protein NA57DRAFT_60343 [Rhizodiscina lignyota]|uniref:NACHT-NTPase and P-loop NTPases N-terminal domain-containing protein n=1 Tax=Rhizodiscina lignyota TaxID=1504668 RepID=A0A9P4I4F2_9PEZI|nr:hypothetical protein NA57DRAFT_60343 [Rhizodiscina lignyota]
MAEVLATASAVVGVAAAAGQLIDGIAKLKAFCAQIRDIPNDIQNIVDDLSTLTDVLDFVQAEMGQASYFPSNPGATAKVLSNLQQSSQQVQEVLKQMQAQVGKKKYWGRVKAVEMKRKLDKAALRLQNVQNMLLVSLTIDNRCK